jgi:hypothetical protein
MILTNQLEKRLLIARQRTVALPKVVNGRHDVALSSVQINGLIRKNHHI